MLLNTMRLQSWQLKEKHVDGPSGPIFDLDTLLQQQRCKQPEQSLNCAQCHAPVTRAGERIEINNQHTHTCTNPHGFSFHIGCFATAPGVIGEGAPSTFWSWFTGYRWQTVICQQCGTHLGWRFYNSNSFFGLILNRLIELNPNKLH